MNVSEQIASHFRQLHFGENWTSVNLKEALADVDWMQANKKIEGCHTIAGLVFHINYYVQAVTMVLQGNELKARDIDSFDPSPLRSPTAWSKLLQKTWANAEQFANLVQQLPDSQLGQTFADAKYGTYHRNLLGVIEHGHYHLGQIVLIKKLLKKNVFPLENSSS